MGRRALSVLPFDFEQTFMRLRTHQIVCRTFGGEAKSTRRRILVVFVSLFKKIHVGIDTNNRKEYNTKRRGKENGSRAT